VNNALSQRTNPRAATIRISNIYCERKIPHCQAKHRSNVPQEFTLFKYHCYPLLNLLQKLGLKITPFIIELSIFIHPKENTN